MARSEARRQKKLAKRKQQRTEKRRELRRVESRGPLGLLPQFASGEIIECLVATTIDTDGIGGVLMARAGTNGRAAMATFLVDRYCLGVKDAFADVYPVPMHDAVMARVEKSGEYEEIDPESARRLVEDAVEYARGLGLPPHRDYAAARAIFGDIDPSRATEIFEMGSEGQPLFIAGPYDSPARCRAIVGMLERTCGPEGYHYVCPAGPDFFEDLQFIDEQEADDRIP